MKALTLGEEIKIPHHKAYDFGTAAFTAMAVVCPKAIKTSSSASGETKKTITATGTIMSNRTSLNGKKLHDYHSYLDYHARFGNTPAKNPEMIEYIEKNYRDVKNFEDGSDKGDWTFSIISQQRGPNFSDEYFLRFNLRTLHDYNTGGIGYDLLARIPSFYQNKIVTSDDDKETLDKLRAEYAYHVAAVRDAKGEMRLYLNGYLLAEVSLNAENNGGFGTYQLKTLVKKDVSKPSQYIVLKQQDDNTEIKLEKPNNKETIILAPESSFWKYDQAKKQKSRELIGNADTPYKKLRIYKEEKSGEDAQQTTLSIEVDGKLMLAYRPVSTPITNVTNKCELKIGGFNPLSFSTKLKGFIQNVSLWNKALSQGEIIDFMNPAKAYTANIETTILPEGGIRLNPATKTGWITAKARMKYKDINSANTYEATATYDGDTEISEQAEISSKRNELTLEANKQAKIKAAQKLIAKTGAASSYSYDVGSGKLTYFKKKELNGCIGFWKFDDDGMDSSDTANHVPKSENLSFKEPKVILPLFMEEQKADYWCWAASSTSVVKFFNPLTAWKQCSLATKTLKDYGPEMNPSIVVSADCNCCKNIASDPQNNFKTSAECDKGFDISLGLKVAGYHFYLQKPFNPKNLDEFDQAIINEIKSELFNRKPIGVALNWGGEVIAGELLHAAGAVHIVFIIGITEDSFVIVDSIHGISIVPQSRFPSKYKQGGTSAMALYFTKS